MANKWKCLTSSISHIPVRRQKSTATSEYNIIPTRLHLKITIHNEESYSSF